MPGYAHDIREMLEPLHFSSFRTLWIADQIANIGAFAHAVATAWILVEYSDDPSVVALARTASTAPVLMLSLVGGSLADSADRRLVQLGAQIWICMVLLVLAAVTAAGLESPTLILLLTFGVGLGVAVRVPAWQAAIRDYVPHSSSPAAITLNSSAFNVSRAIGPVVGGMAVVLFSASGAFVYSALSAMVLVIALYRSPPLPVQATETPRSGLLSGVRSGLAYVRTTVAIRSTMVRTVGVCVPASAGLALLPIVVKSRLGGDAVDFGILLGCFGVGAFVVATRLPRWRRRLTPDAVLTYGSVGFGLALLGMAAATTMAGAVAALVLAGASWVAMLSTLNTSVQLAAQHAMRGRAVSAYLTCSFGGIAAGSVVWGGLASLLSVSLALTIAGLLVAASILLRRAHALPVDSTGTALSDPRSVAIKAS